MGTNPDAAGQLVRYGLPVMLLWFNIGFAIAVLYHLSLLFVDKEFRNKNTLVLDVFVSAMRFLLYVVAWPVVLYFDRSAMARIRVFVDWVFPSRRKESIEVEEAKGEAELAAWEERKRTADELRAQALAELPLERERRKVELHESNPRLDGFWLLAAVGRDSAGASELVWLYGPGLTLDEVTERARTEVGLRREAFCPNCEERLAVARVAIPGLAYLRVLDYSDGPVVDGWALEGRYTIEWQPCDECAGSVPPVEEDVTRLGRAREVIRAMRSGLVFHQDVCEGPEQPAKPA
ncbi:MAG: hypothetical protein R6X13_10085 [bacterium]